MLLFVVLNLVRSELHVSAPYAAFARLGTNLMTFRTFNLISPLVFIGGGLAALAISTSAFVRVRRKSDGSTVSITALELRANWTALLLAFVASCCLVILVTYAAVEQLLTGTR